MQRIGIMALITIISHIFFIMISYVALQSLRTDYLFKKGHEKQIQLLYMLLSVAIGWGVSSFVLDILTYSSNLLFLFE